MSVLDLDSVGPYCELAVDPQLVTTLRDIHKRALDIDQTAVSRADIEALSRAGYFASSMPVELGGLGCTDPTIRELTELLAACSGAVWFVAAQHRSPQLAVATTTNPALVARFRDGLVSGELLGAVAFAHVRRPGPPSVRARRTAGGWIIDGTLEWLTSWGLAEAVLLLAVTDDDHIVSMLLPAEPREGLIIAGRLGLAAMTATHTVVVELASMRVADDEVAVIEPRARWLARDTERTANASPAVFGLLRAIVADLRRVGEQRGDETTIDLAARLARRTTQLRSSSYQLIDAVAPSDLLDRRLALRAASLELVGRAATARIVAEGGKAMTLQSSAQRWAREAMFALVQAQTAPLRQRLLSDLGSRLGEEEV